MSRFAPMKQQYIKGIEGYKQLMVNHSAGEYVNGIVHTKWH